MALKSKKTSLKIKTVKSRKPRTKTLKTETPTISTPLKETKKVSLLKKVFSFIFNK